MHRLVIAAAAAAVLSVAGAAQAGWGGQAPGWSSGPSCGCGGYQGYEGSSWGDQDGYVDQDDLYSYGYRSYDYVPFDGSTDYRSDEGYRSAYDYGRSAEGYGRGTYDESQYGAYEKQPRERYYPHSYGYERHYRAPTHSYRDYHYTPPHYSAPHHRGYGHSSYDGERG